MNPEDFEKMRLLVELQKHQLMQQERLQQQMRPAQMDPMQWANASGVPRWAFDEPVTTATRFLRDRARRKQAAQPPEPTPKLEPVALGELKVGMEFAPVARALEFVK